MKRISFAATLIAIALFGAGCRSMECDVPFSLVPPPPAGIPVKSVGQGVQILVPCPGRVTLMHRAIWSAPRATAAQAVSRAVFDAREEIETELRRAYLRTFCQGNCTKAPYSPQNIVTTRVQTCVSYNRWSKWIRPESEDVYTAYVIMDGTMVVECNGLPNP